MKKTNDQTVLENGARIDVNINTNETKKSGGFKRGAVVGTLGGIFLGGAGVAYAVENDITMEDVKDGINDVVDGFNRGVNAAFSKETATEETATEEKAVVNDAVAVEETSAEEVVAEEPVVEESTEEVAVEETSAEDIAIEESAEDVVAEQRLTAEEVLEALKGATAEQEAPEVVEEVETPELTWQIDESVAVAGGVDDEMSFDEAFAAARAEVGAGGAFEWRGGLYGTYYAEEWESMSAEEKAEFGAKFEFSAVEEAEEQTPIDVTLDELLAEEPMAEAEEQVAIEEPAFEEPAAEVDAEPEVEVAVDNVYNVSDAHGNESSYVQASVNGEDVQLIDVDGDGTIDVMIYDENNDGVIDEAETLDVSQEGLQVEAFVEMVEEPTFEEPAIEEPMIEDVVADDTMDDVVADDIMA